MNTPVLLEKEAPKFAALQAVKEISYGSVCRRPPNLLTSLSIIQDCRNGFQSL